MGVAGVIVSGIQIADDIQVGNDRAATLHIADAAMGIIAFVPGGQLLAIGWFVSRIFWDEETFK